jgi:hypothetical protein
LAKEGALLFKGAGLIGWDIAPVETGAIVVEGNVTPDFFLPQLAERRGALDSDFQRFLAERKLRAHEWKRKTSRDALESHRPTWI